MIKKCILLLLFLLANNSQAGYFDTIQTSFSQLFENMKTYFDPWFATQKQEMITPEIWQKKAYTKPVGDKIQAFKNSVKKALKENKKIPAKTDLIVRIATYNVHFWRAPGKKWDDDDNQTAIFEVIKNINADVLILQEVRAKMPFNDSDIKKNLENLGYKSIAGCNTFPSKKDWFGVVIASKLEPISKKRITFKTQERPSKEDRCYLQALFALKNNKKLLVYGTHLEVGKLDKKDVQPASESIRKAQLEEIIASIKHEQTKNNITNILLAADFNSVRKQDYEYRINNKKVWDLVESENKKIFGFYPTSTKTLNMLKKEHFKDSFSYLGWSGPKFTTWTGTVIDFIFLVPTWDLPIAGSYIYYSQASDHLPLILDIKQPL